MALAHFRLRGRRQLGLLFVVLVVFRFLLRPYLAPLLTHPKDRAADDGEEREAD